MKTATNGANKLGRVTTEVQLANSEDRTLAKHAKMPAEDVRVIKLPAVIDSGASYLVIPKSAAITLGVPSAGKATVTYADRRKAKRDLVSNVEVELLGRQGIFKAIVEPDRDSVLIGAIVLEDLDLLVDCRTQTLQPRDPKGIVAEIE